MLSASPLERKLQLSGIILILGLVVESLCILGHGPIAFMLFVGLGGVLFAVGILLFFDEEGKARNNVANLLHERFEIKTLRALACPSERPFFCNLRH